MLWEALEALAAPVIMATIFVALLVTAYRATDGARRRPDGRAGERSAGGSPDRPEEMPPRDT